MLTKKFKPTGTRSSSKKSVVEEATITTLSEEGSSSSEAIIAMGSLELVGNLTGKRALDQVDREDEQEVEQDVNGETT